MLIFDRFPSPSLAMSFAESVEQDHGLDARLYVSARTAQADDPFPGELVPPIVHVERSDDADVEREVEEAVTAFGGRFQGT